MKSNACIFGTYNIIFIHLPFLTFIMIHQIVPIFMQNTLKLLRKCLFYNIKIFSLKFKTRYYWNSQNSSIKPVMFRTCVSYVTNLWKVYEKKRCCLKKIRRRRLSRFFKYKIFFAKSRRDRLRSIYFIFIICIIISENQLK